MTKSLYIGLMSGTSMDGIDAALVDFSQNPPILCATLETKLPSELKNTLLKLCQPGDNEIDTMGAADISLGVAFADAANTLIQQAGINASDVIAIGSHGQTIRHRPPQKTNHTSAFTLQIGDPNTIAELTGVTTVADFRRRDISAGGHGAPLAPAFHAHVFSSKENYRVAVNIGGISNITLLPGSKGSETPVIGFDTGPGNGLMDAWIQQQQSKPYDHNGEWAAKGSIHQELLAQLLQHPFLQEAAPKSTGREDFNIDWLNKELSAYSLDAIDIQATLAEFTAKSLGDQINKHAPSNSEVIICGGGAYNPHLISRIQVHLPDHQVNTSDHYDLPACWIEAMAFAWLAEQRIENKSGNLPSVTGASGHRTLGAIYPGK